MRIEQAEELIKKSHSCEFTGDLVTSLRAAEGALMIAMHCRAKRSRWVALKAHHRIFSVAAEILMRSCDHAARSEAGRAKAYAKRIMRDED